MNVNQHSKHLFFLLFLRHIPNIRQLASLIKEPQNFYTCLTDLCHCMGSILAHSHTMSVSTSINGKCGHLVFIHSIILYINKCAWQRFPSFIRGSIMSAECQSCISKNTPNPTLTIDSLTALRTDDLHSLGNTSGTSLRNGKSCNASDSSNFFAQNFAQILR